MPIKQTLSLENTEGGEQFHNAILTTFAVAVADEWAVVLS